MLPQKPRMDSAIGDDGSILPHLSRTPRPYHNPEGSKELHKDIPDRYLPSPALTPPPSSARHNRERKQHETQSGTLSRRNSSSPEDSTAEFDDEHSFIKALPAPVARPRKGLKIPGSSGWDGQVTPFLTPSQLNGASDTKKDYFAAASGTSRKELQREIDQAAPRFRSRRRAELLRRACELASFASIGFLVFYYQPGVLQAVKYHQDVLITATTLVFILLLLFPCRLLWRSFLSGHAVSLTALKIPAAFDPAPLLYPPLLPLLIASSLCPTYSSAILPNVILGISALPAQLIPNLGRGHTSYNALHWIITLLPLLTLSSSTRRQTTSSGELLIHPLSPSGEIPQETLALLFPLHQALLTSLGYLTTTSLLTAELQLLSTSLINILLLGNSPQVRILMTLLWIGGVGLFVFCGPVCKWNIALERVPSWRFRQMDSAKQGARSFFMTLSQALNNTDTLHDMDKASIISIRSSSKSRRLRTVSHGSASYGQASISPLTTHHSLDGNFATLSPDALDSADATNLDLKRPQTAPSNPHAEDARTRRRTQSMNSQSYLSLTTYQAEIRKWSYAFYAYAITAVLILLPVRLMIQHSALDGVEPFVWAAGYLFGDIAAVGTMPFDPGVTINTSDSTFPLSWLQLPKAGLPHLRDALGRPTTRLILFGYWAFTIALGIITVIRLSSFAEVDTRRKVFHGMMVLMLLPSTYVDPCFLSLGLILVLAVFLLLDLFRAAQLRPLSKPLARFLTPYVDGRDLRGPVVVSHIFLLVGCAIPLWLSLAGTRHVISESGVEDGWELATRDVSMVAGVICVGMGDAAASLVGRRYGRRKWPWAGGKSLEGSAAFAIAVTVGLVVAKLWLRLGGWVDAVANDTGFLAVVAKAGVAASGASFTEAVLTGANDNVVVPVVLWLLVRGLSL